MVNVIAPSGFEQQSLLSCLQTLALPTLLAVAAGLLFRLVSELASHLYSRLRGR